MTSGPDAFLVGWRAERHLQVFVCLCRRREAVSQPVRASQSLSFALLRRLVPVLLSYLDIVWLTDLEF